MRNNYKDLAVATSLLLASFVGFAQESPKKPIKKLKVFNQTETKSVANSQQVLSQQLQLPEGNSLSKISEKVDELGYFHREYQQYYKNVKVAFSSSKIHAKDGSIVAMSNNVFRIKDVSVSPKLSNVQALNRALAHVGANTYLWENRQEANLANNYEKPTGELVVFPAIENVSTTNRLAYKFDIYATAPLYRADVYIDANTGAFIMENKRIHHADTPATGSSLYNGNVSFTADSNGGQYRLRQTADGNGIQTYDLNNGTNYNNASDITSSSTTFNGNATGVQAHWGAEQTHKYFFQNHNRNSYNGSGAVIRSYVSYSSNYVNAFWDGSRMTYGDGDGVNYGPLVSLDIVGHEIAHGVTEYSANLVYSYESGALNESFSDIFGESIENFAQGNNDWLMGDDIGAGGSGGALRSMSNPNAYNQPDTYLGTNWYSGSGDNGGVHYNSGVQNFWFYLLSVGGNGTNDNGDSYSVSAIGMDAAASIAYRNLAVYLNSNSQYDDARAGAIQAAIDLYGAGSAEEIAVTNAWHAVGVGQPYDGGNPPPPEECATGDVYLSITFDNYPEETAWTLKDSSGTTIDSESYSSSNADGSTVNVTFSGLAADDYTFTITDSYGDGICCSYGNGSYTLSSDDGTIFAGGDFGSSEATQFCIEDGGIGADTEAPSDPTGLTASNVTETTIDLSWNASSDNIGVTEYEVYQGSSLLGTTANTSTQITGLVANTSYTFSVKAKDAAGNVSGTSNVVNVTTGSPSNVEYCDSQGNNSSYEWIDLVRLNNLDNATGNNGGYADFTTMSANVPYGSNTIYISAGFSSSSYREYWKIWIDYDQDGIFETNEAVVSGSSTSSGTLNASFSVPTSAAAGPTRMRVSMKYNSAQGACESFTYGEVEDYTVNIGQPFYTAGGSTDGENLGASVAAFGINVYPNPANSVLNVELLDNREATYEIYNVLGQQVLNGSINRTATINVDTLSNGLYLVKINDGQKELVERFIKE
jgi:Zn-dependent metalloprotease|tara:strand:+ start:63543 stop:66500 length:2958 start_codon:yes stop_codon:yes gene_type:complete